ncbi:unnamed protein product [Macrosiphum euphorbiae]|uniref:Uncharacterized protein n=1 Tax=Macrosiphum euphorbiae TaxID=13131 RepID=A0AAV0Y2X0_9HEMI|nr:unnamed protein product [Macrosiphum euphorbiae]
MRYDERSKPMAQQKHMRYELPQKPMRYEADMPLNTRIEQQQPMPPSMRFEQQYRSPQQQQPSSTRYGQQQQTQNKPPSNGYVFIIINS